MECVKKLVILLGLGLTLVVGCGETVDKPRKFKDGEIVTLKGNKNYRVIIVEKWLDDYIVQCENDQGEQPYYLYLHESELEKVDQ